MLEVNLWCPMLDFPKTFETLTDHPPFPWQTALYERFCREGDGNIPKACNLPTGLGKTSVIAIWLIALANKKNVPRRLVYVVNRRTVVDQTTDEVEKYQKNLAKAGIVEPLAISTLRGQHADKGDWYADPSRPAVICGTVDMIGSRLLFSGYGIGFKGKPLHAGFLGQDALLVHDEAHLEPAFQKLIEAIEKEQERCNEFRKFRVMELTATSRNGEKPFELTPLDYTNAKVLQRIGATKNLELIANRDPKKLADEIAALALKYKDRKLAILVFVRTVDDVLKVRDKLEKENQQVETLTGTLRGKERDELVLKPTFKRFLPEAVPGDKAVYLVCTSAGEVGVNISADHLVCDLSTFESMAQRFGRVNRFGLRDDTEIHVVYPTEFDPKKQLDPRCELTLALLRNLAGDASPAALGKLSAAARLAAFAPEPTILPVTDILFDAWALTTIKEKLPGRPPVEPYLHGLPTEWQPPDTQVAWREEVSALNVKPWTDWPKKEFEKLAFDLLDDCPLKPHELLKDNARRVFDRLRKLKAPPETPVWVQSQDGAVKLTSLGVVAAGESDDLNYLTVILPPEAGGLNEQGMLDDKASSAVRDVSDELFLKDKAGAMVQQRIRLENPEENDVRTKNMHSIRTILFPGAEQDEDAVGKAWEWFRILNEGDASTKHPVLWHIHVGDVRKRADEILATLPLSHDLKKAVAFAAEYHDHGKKRKMFQTVLGNRNYPAVVLAKSGGKGVRLKEAYRHEFGSLLEVKKLLTDGGLAAELQEHEDLILHLIAAHHGYARPHFPEPFDPEPPPGTSADDMAMSVPRRFARLQRKYGRWGLAYLESLLRAADWAASADPSEFVTEEKK